MRQKWCFSFLFFIILISRTSGQGHSILLVIDVQEEFTQKLDDTTSDELLSNINTAIDEHREGTIVFVKANIRVLSISFKGIKVEQAENLVLDHRLKINPNDKVWMKNEGSAFSIDSLNYLLDSLDIHKIYICGMYGDECVKATAEEGLARGYDIEMLWDAILFKKEKKRKGKKK